MIRLDGPDGADTPPPTRATPDLLTDAIRTAATAADVPGPVIDGRAHTFAFGRQLDIRPIRDERQRAALAVGGKVDLAGLPTSGASEEGGLQ